MTKARIAAALSAALLLTVPVAGLRSVLAQPEQPGRAWPPEPAEPGHGMRKPGQVTNYDRSAHKLMNLVGAIHSYARDHDGFLPPDLGATLPYMHPATVEREGEGSLARLFLSPIDLKTKAVPETPTPDWVNRHSSFRYLGKPDVRVEDIADWATTIIVYERLENSYPVMQPDQTLEVWHSYATLQQSGGWAFSRQEAETKIADSAKAIEAARTGGEAPDEKQAIWDLGQIAQAIHAYAKAHAGRLPPDLGATLAHLPTEGRRGSPSQRAGLFLSPAKRRTTVIPQDPTPDWVNQNTSYTYLGGADLDLQRIPHPDQTVLVYGELDHGYPYPTRTGEVKLIPFARVRASIEHRDRKNLELDIALSKEVFEAVRGRRPIPDVPQASYDVGRLGAAIFAYTQANEDRLPPDLGATLAYLDASTLIADTPAERARIFLTPAAERTTALPSEITPEWVNRNANYVYLGGPGMTRAQIKSANRNPVVLHSPRSEPFRMQPIYGDEPSIAVGFALPAGSGWAWVMSVRQFDEDYAEGLKKLDEIRAAAGQR